MHYYFILIDPYLIIGYFYFMEIVVKIYVRKQSFVFSKRTKVIIMKTFLCLCALVAIAFARPEDKYTDKYDKIDVDELLSNRRLLIPYIKCILDEGKCSADGRELKCMYLTFCILELHTYR